MARKKKKKVVQTESNTNISVIVLGLILILFSIIGLSNSGAIGIWVKNISIFMFGSWFFLFLIFTLGLGLYMVFKSGRPAFFAARLVGIYSLILSILILSHIKFIHVNELVNKDIVSTTYNMVLESFEDATLVKTTGGGVIGSVFTWLSMIALGDIGTYILAFIFIIIGIILVFDISLSNVFSSIVSIFRNVPVNEEEDEEDIEEQLSLKDKNDVIGSLPDNGLSDKKVVITSISDLNNMPKEAPVEENNNIEEDSEPGVYIKPSLNAILFTPFKLLSLCILASISKGHSEIE